MSGTCDALKTLADSGSEEQPKWYLAMVEGGMEAGMTREEAEEFAKFELLFGGNLIWQYAEKAKAGKTNPGKPTP